MTIVYLSCLVIDFHFVTTEFNVPCTNKLSTEPYTGHKQCADASCRDERQKVLSFDQLGLMEDHTAADEITVNIYASMQT